MIEVHTLNQHEIPLTWPCLRSTKNYDCFKAARFGLYKGVFEYKPKLLGKASHYLHNLIMMSNAGVVVDPWSHRWTDMSDYQLHTGFGAIALMSEET